MRPETILKIYNTLVLPPFLYGSENWTEMKLLRPLAGYTLYDHKTNDYICRELCITGILDKIDEYRRNWLSHLQRMPQNQIPLKSYHYRPEGRRTIGRLKKRSCNSGDGMDQTVQSLMFMMMMMTNFLSIHLFSYSSLLQSQPRKSKFYCICTHFYISQKQNPNSFTGYTMPG